MIFKTLDSILQNLTSWHNATKNERLEIGDQDKYSRLDQWRALAGNNSSIQKLQDAYKAVLFKLSKMKVFDHAIREMDVETIPHDPVVR
ncbi:MAG: hypothetical protein IPO26_21200 [Saprospiraceae bacterium]|nr:hypothetical protein [Saprospiraceae bacterium]